MQSFAFLNLKAICLWNKGQVNSLIIQDVQKKLKKLVLSKIYEWNQDDFSDDETEDLIHQKEMCK